MTRRPPLGQHFLHDPHVLRSIVAAGEPDPRDHALEVGPGRGALTRVLAPRVENLIAVELDSVLAERLTKELAFDQPTLTVVHNDILKTDLDALFPPRDPPEPILLYGNLPYSVTSPILEKLMPWPHWKRAVFLVQAEVASRMIAPEGSRTFGVLSLAVQLFATAKRVLKVKPGSFRPPPRVDSAVVRLERRPVPLLPPAREPVFFDLVRAAFSHRRKTLINSLQLATGASKTRLADWLMSQSIQPTVRPETVSLAQYVAMTDGWLIFRRENCV